MHLRTPRPCADTHAHTPLCEYGLSTGPTEGLSSWWLRNRSANNNNNISALRCGYASLSGLVVARLPAAREGPGSNRAADKSFFFRENHGDMQLWARAAH